MKKTVKIIGIGFAILCGVIFISMIFSGEAQESFDKGQNNAKQMIENMEK